MAATTMAATAGAVVLLYYVLTRRYSAAVEGGGENEEGVEMLKKSRRISRWRPVAQAPATWMETISTLAETVKFTYSETLGKWPIGDLAFGIKYLIKRQGNLPVASLYVGENSTRLKGPEIISRLYHYLKLLTLCMFFSKKPFPVFLESAGFSLEDVLLQKPKAGLLKPAFTIICDKDSKCFLLLIRGTHSIKDTLTAATGTVVPFHHSVLDDGGISNLVLGYAHCGMVAAARWIANLSKPFLFKGLAENPDYEVKIVGHSLGGGTAALLTYILREQKEFSSTTCVTFAPGACMTWELAESGKHFITTIINGSDLVPTFSAASVDDLRSEVTASSWVSDLRDQVERNRVLNMVYRSATALSSRLPSISNAKAKMAVAGSILRPVSSSTQVVMKRAQDVAQAVVSTQYSLSSWACMGPRRRAVAPSSLIPDEHAEVSLLSGRTSEVSLLTERSSGASSKDTETNITVQYSSSSSGGSGHEDTDEEEDLIRADKIMSPPTLREIAEGELWYELEKELQRQEEEADVNEQEEAAVAVEEIVEEETVLADAVESHTPISSSDVSDNQHLYPPGKIMHIVSMVSSDMMDDNPSEEEQVSIYETRRELYNKLRLSTTMIKDHYMPMYKKMMELLIRELENEDGSDFESSNDRH
ncbi:hypothetical protein Leryth_018425 [Lithospermum erythrorhizon]|nr:hypothetical protein Leryth_018425 [Lithospermum erythrorhizon]